jgi:acetyl-CoA acetyltransferase
VTRRDRQPVIVGSYDGPSGKTGLSASELYLSGAVGALSDAGLTSADADAVLTSYSWEDPQLMHADNMAELLGVRSRYCDTVCLGGASPVGMVGRAARAIAEGACDVAVLASGSNRASGMGRGAAIDALREVAQPHYELPYGVFVPALYALVAQRFMAEFGLKPDQLAAVAVAQRAYAAHMPGAAMTSRLTVDEVRASKPISDPLTMLDCCLITDFSAGLVMTTAAHARELGRPAVTVLGYGEHHGSATLAQAQSLTSFGAKASGKTAFERAGRSPAEVDFAQLYDCFTITVLVTLEDLGLCAPGASGMFVESGETGPEGRLPVNTNGGMLSYATGGMYHVTESVRQLRREAGARQLERSRLAVVNGVGGVFSVNCTVVLGEPA